MRLGACDALLCHTHYTPVNLSTCQRKRPRPLSGSRPRGLRRIPSVGRITVRADRLRASRQRSPSPLQACRSPGATRPGCVEAPCAASAACRCYLSAPALAPPLRYARSRSANPRRALGLARLCCASCSHLSSLLSVRQGLATPDFSAAASSSS